MYLQVPTLSLGSRSRGVFVCLVVALGVTPSAASATSIFIQFSGIKGEATEKNHKDWSEVDSVDWSITARRPVGGGGAPRVQLSDLSWTQPTDKSIPLLFDDMTRGRLIPEVKLDFIAAPPGGQQPVTYLQLDFRDVYLSSLHLGSSGNARLELDGAFSYGRIMMTYTQYDQLGRARGTTSAAYDLKTGVGSLSALANVYALGSAGPDFAVPEPATSALVLAGLALLAARARPRN